MARVTIREMANKNSTHNSMLNTDIEVIENPVIELPVKVIPPNAIRKVISKSTKKRGNLHMEEVVYHFKRNGEMRSITCHEPVKRPKK